MTNYPTDELLSAYVDGELSPDEDSRVADAIARDQRLAARVATLSRVKSALSMLATAPAKTIHLPRRRWSRVKLSVAAALGLLLAVASGVLTGYLDFGGDQDGWYLGAAAIHAEWARDPAAPDARGVDANLYVASVDRLHLPVHAPDLTSARLRLTYLKFHDQEAGSPAALHLGYTGRRGCRLTLWVTAAPKSLSPDLTETRSGALRGFRWRAGNIAYALFATGMAEQRFTIIADKVYQATRTRHGFDEETRLALSETSRKAPPCNA